MKKDVSIARRVVNIICFVLSFIIVLYIISSGMIDVIMDALPIYAGLMVIFIVLPSIMATGNHMVKKQNEIISTQVMHNCPVRIDKGKVVFGYILMFSPLYTFITASIFIPHGIFIAIFIPMAVITSVLKKMKRPLFVDTFRMSAKKYKRAHIWAFVASVIVGFTVRFAVIIPLAAKYM